MSLGRKLDSTCSFDEEGAFGKDLKLDVLRVVPSLKVKDCVLLD